jgi:hypothetical protein
VLLLLSTTHTAQWQAGDLKVFLWLPQHLMLLMVLLLARLHQHQQQQHSQSPHQQQHQPTSQPLQKRQMSVLLTMPLQPLLFLQVGPHKVVGC